METSLYDRLGGSDNIRQIASDVVDNHVNNPRVRNRFADSDLVALKKSAAEFIITGTGGPEVYTGQDMRSTHSGMNIDEAELLAVMSDIMDALDKNGVGQREKEEVLYVLFSMKEEILFA